MKFLIKGKEFGNKVIIPCLIGLVLVFSVASGLIFYNAGVDEGFSLGIGYGKSYAINNDLGEIEAKKSDKLNDLQKQIEENQSAIDAAKDYEQNKDALDAELNEKTSKAEKLDADILSKQSELDKISGNITKAKSAPKVLAAGEYAVGTDLPEGRYSVTGSSNFFVYSSGGSLKVNTILGDGTFENESYTCSLKNGDKINAGSKVTLTPIE